MTCKIIEQQPNWKNIHSDESETRPTLVFDAGMGNWSLFFYPLAEKLKPIAKICMIDRTGYLTSSSGDTCRDAHSIAQEMKNTLTANQIFEPIILVGHSLGGLHVRMYQYLYPENVVGMILLDTAHPGLYEEFPQVETNIQMQIKHVSLLIPLAKVGLLHFAKGKIPTFGLPNKLHRPYYEVTTRAGYYITYREELNSFTTSLEQCKKLGGFGDLPLLVISSQSGLNGQINQNGYSNTEEDRTWVKLQQDLCLLSSDTTFIKSKGDHFLHLTDTTTLAIAIREFYYRLLSLPPVKTNENISYQSS